MLVTRADFSRDLSTFETPAKIPPKQLAWCGADAVLAYWETGTSLNHCRFSYLDTDSHLYMIGPNAKYKRYPDEYPLFLIPEIDGVRIFSKRGCEYIQRVPGVVTSIYKIGSTAPPALLVASFESFERNDPSATDTIRILKGNGEEDLREAVNGCVVASGQEFSVELQKKMLRAATYGRVCDFRCRLPNG